MMIHDITGKVGRHASRKRVGRGHGSGHGKTSGRGHKGAGSRSGYSRRAYFEGGQMTWTRRIPKRGFTNNAFRKRYHVVNLKVLEERVEDGADVTVEVLAHLGLIRDASLPLKILGDGEITKKFNVTAAKLSRSAVAKIEAAGGTVTEVPLTKWMRKKKA
ncbi:MAG: 50S ribosomal protein L15 [Phycisphaerales bacterium]|nr:50S ribosomal protein L15 [Phycisphaerales bacterium]